MQKVDLISMSLNVVILVMFWTYFVRTDIQCVLAKAGPYAGEQNLPVYPYLRT
jgi:hypothetical protein